MRISTSVLDHLKRVVLDRANIHNLMPGDCKAIAEDVLDKTNRQVSETTIKRMFGFTGSQHSPSIYTLTSLSVYVGFQSWESFCEYASIDHESDNLYDIPSIERKSHIVTEHSLRMIRNHTGIPYSLTIPRKYAFTDFDCFLKSKYKLTCIVAHPGHGKSVMLSHVVNKLFQKPDSPYADSTLWLINVDDLPSGSSIEVESWLNGQMGFNLNNTASSSMNEFLQKSRKKAVLIIDGINEQDFRENKFGKLFNCLTELLCDMESKAELKVVLSMRSTQWPFFYDEIRSSAHLRSLWYPGSYFNFETNSNVPYLNKQEISKIFRKIEHDFKGFSSIDPKLAAQCKIPIYIQLYYQLREKHVAYNYQNEITSFELISTFINQKVLLSKYSSEKTYLLTKLVRLKNKEEKGRYIVKSALLNDIATFNYAYQDLLVQGVIVEEKYLIDSVPHEIIRFIHPHLFEYFLHLEVLETFNHREDMSLIDYIENRFKNYKHKMQLIQWMLRHLLVNKNPSPISQLLHSSLSSSEKLYLVFVTAETIHWKSIQSLQLVNDQSYDKLHQNFIDQLCQMDFADPYFGSALQSLLKLKNTPDNEYSYRVLYACWQMIRFDKKGLSESIEYLKKSAIDFSSFPFNPTEYLMGINDILNNSPINPSLCKQIDAFIKNSRNQTQFNNTDLTSQEKLSYLTVIMICFFEKNPTRGLAIMNTICLRHPHFFEGGSSYATMILTLEELAAAYLKPQTMSIESGTNEIGRARAHTKTKDESQVSLYNKILHLITQTQLEINRENYKTALKIATKAHHLCKEYKIAFFEMVVYFNIIEIGDKISNLNRKKLAIDQVYHLMEEKNISLSIFQESFDVGDKNYRRETFNLENFRNGTGRF